MLRVASIPSHHAYVRRVLPAVAAAPYPAVDTQPGPEAAGSDVARLPDPLPPDREPAEGVWWPPRLLEAGWLAPHAATIDAVHLHFGFEGRTPAELRQWLDELHAHRIPLALTVHDLENPHLGDQAAHLTALDVLVPAADALLTLTPGAAAEIARRWGCEALVLPHPQLAPDDDVLAADAARTQPHRPRVGLHLGALRAGADPSPWLPALVAATARAGADLHVLANDEVARDPERRGRLDALAAQLAGHAHARLDVVPRLDDDALHAWVAGLDVAALPHRHGTHSGWVELCWDLGTSVLAAPVGFLAEQHDDPGFHGFLTADGAVDALTRLLAARSGGCPWGDAESRLARRAGVDADTRAAHAEAYARLVSRAQAAPTASAGAR